MNVVSRENINRPVGSVQEGKFDVLLRTLGQYQSLDDLRNLVVSTRNGIPVHLREVAAIEDSSEDVTQRVSVNGTPSVRVYLYKQSGSQYCRSQRRDLEGSGITSEGSSGHHDYFHQ